MPPIQVKRPARFFGIRENSDCEFEEKGRLRPATVKEGLRRSLLEPISVSLVPHENGPMGFFKERGFQQISEEKNSEPGAKENWPPESLSEISSPEIREVAKRESMPSMARGLQESWMGLGGPMMVGITLMGLLSFFSRRKKSPPQLRDGQKERPLPVRYESRHSWIKKLSPYHLKESLYYLKSDLTHYGLLGLLSIAIVIFGVGSNVFNEIARGIFKIKRRTKGVFRLFRDKLNRPKPIFDSPSGPDLLITPYRAKGLMATHVGERDLVRRAQYLRRRLHSWDRIKNEKELEAIAEEYFDLLSRVPVGHPEFQLGLHTLNRLAQDGKRMAYSEWQRDYKVRRFGPQVQLPVLRVLKQLYGPYVEKKLPRTVMLRAFNTLKVMAQKKVFVWATQSIELFSEYRALYHTLVQLLPKEHAVVKKARERIDKLYRKHVKGK